MSGSRRIRLGTRGSRLALAQSEWVAARIRAAAGVEVALVTVRTTGDVVTDRPLVEIGGQGLFTRELDRAVLEGEVDVAVHSLKDLPTVLADGVRIAAVPEREDSRDVLVGPEGSPTSLDGLTEGTRLGTGSLRRQALALASRPDLRVEAIRGNIETRIRLVDEGAFGAVVLAAAGLRRLGWAHRASETLDSAGWLPAPGQGALAVVVRDPGPNGLPDWAAALDDPPTRAAVTAERALLHRLEAGCRLPVAALGIPYGSGMRLKGMVLSPDGRRAAVAEATGRLEEPEELGYRVAALLVERGGDRILQDVLEGAAGGGFGLQ